MQVLQEQMLRREAEEELFKERVQSELHEISKRVNNLAKALYHPACNKELKSSEGSISLAVLVRG